MKTIILMASLLMLPVVISADWTDSIDTGAINTNSQLVSSDSQRIDSQSSGSLKQQANSQSAINGSADGEIEFQIELKGKLRSHVDTQMASSMQGEQNTVVSGSAMSDAYPGATFEINTQNQSSQSRMNSAVNNWIPWNADVGKNSKSWNMPWHNETQAQRWSPWNWTNKGVKSAPK